MLAKKEDPEENIRFNLALSFFAFKDIDINNLLYLQYISKFKSSFAKINPPKYERYDLNNFTYSSVDIIEILKCSFIDINVYRNTVSRGLFEAITDYNDRTLVDYKNLKINSSIVVEKQVNSQWPAKSCGLNFSTCNLFKNPLNIIDSNFKNWHQNLNLTKFFEDIKETYDKLPKFKIDESNILNLNIISISDRTFSNFSFLFDFGNKLLKTGA